MLSLIELAKEGKLEKTGAKPKLPIKVDGVSSETLDVYKIPLEYVYYNDKNGRIATGISQYQDELNPANDQEDPQYNNFVAKLIEQDNSSALKRTEKSIQESGQQVYGYVLDGGQNSRRFLGQSVNFIISICGTKSTTIMSGPLSMIGLRQM